MTKRLLTCVLGLFAACFAFGCAGATAPTMTAPAISTAPASQSVTAGQTVTFTVVATGTGPLSYQWQKNGVNISGATSASFTIPATAASDSGSFDVIVSNAAGTVTSTSVTLTVNAAASAASIATQPKSLTVTAGQTATFTVVAAGTAPFTYQWQRNGANISGATSASFTTAATAITDSASMFDVIVSNSLGTITSVAVELTVTSAQGVSPAAAVRFLEQSSFGPNSTEIANVEQMGFPAYINVQFSAPMSTYPDPASTVTSLLSTQQVLFTNALTGKDQLRQRVAFALSELWVTSGFTIPPQGMAPYMRLLLQDAFVNYRTIMNDVTLSPAMGRYLDMVNNDKPITNPVTHANENYARELMQLFTIGLNQLNLDGSARLDSSQNPIPTYAQTNVQAMARAFTGWTYAPMSGATPQKHNPINWLAPMVAFESNHDVAQKVLLSYNGSTVTLPANQSAEQDLAGALDDIFGHPSLAPFVCKQLIQHLVTSNPSPAYIQRVVTVFNSGTFSGYGATFGSGNRGDMQAVIAAILLDPEARRGDDPTSANPTDGHLREPILFIANILRAFGAASDGAVPVSNAMNMSEAPLDSPSVFNFFPPTFNIPGTPLLGPEFSLQTTATTLLRANFVNTFVFGSFGTGTTVDFTPYATLAANPANPGQLLDALNTLLLHGAMDSATRSSILAAVSAVPAGSTQNLTRAKTAIYLLLTSSQYQVEQ
jgi:uncharacterized protein (DUF1800 family)